MAKAKLAAAIVAVSSLLVAGCGERPEKAETADTKTASAECADEGERLKLTGLCAGRAVNYLNMDTSASPEAPDGCGWEVMETQIVDDVLLYRGLKCGDRMARLEYAGGAKRAELQLTSSAFSGTLAEPETQVYLYTIEGDALQGVTQRGREAIESKAEAKNCSARPANQDFWPSDAIVIDVPAAEAAKAPKGEIRTACGPLGLNEDETSYWRVAQGYGWFFQLGQDAFEIDPASFTMMTKAADGTWATM